LSFVRRKDINIDQVEFGAKKTNKSAAALKKKKKVADSKFCRISFRNCARSVLKPLGALLASFGNVFSSFRSSGHKAHNSNIFELDKILWTKTGKSLLQEHAFTKIVSTYLFSFFRQLVWKRQNQMTQNCSASSNFRFYLAVRRDLALIRGFGAPIAFDFGSATQIQSSGPPCKVTARRGPANSHSNS